MLEHKSSTGTTDESKPNFFRDKVFTATTLFWTLVVGIPLAGIVAILYAVSQL